MNKVFYIATTQGLVRIQSIRHDPNDDKSFNTVCVNKSTRSADIARPYEAFVRKNTGIILNRFPEGHYRVDISDNVSSNGNSWQLGIYAAHWLFYQGGLVDQEPEVEDEIYIFSGEVSPLDGSVQPIHRVADKIEAAEDKVVAWQALGHHIKFVVAKGQGPTPLIEKIDFGDIDIAQFEFIEIQQVDDLGSLFSSEAEASITLVPEVECPSIPATVTNNTVTVNKSGVWLFSLTLGVALAAAILLLLGKVPCHMNPICKVSQQSLQVDAAFGNGGSCEQTSLHSVRFLDQEKNILEPVILSDICGLYWQSEDHTVFTAVIPRDANNHLKGYVLKALEQKEGIWSLPLPKSLTSDAKYYVLALSGDEQRLTEEILKELKEQLFKWDLSGVSIDAARLSDWMISQRLSGEVLQHRLSVRPPVW